MAMIMRDIICSLKVILRIMFLFTMNQGLAKNHLYKDLGRNTSEPANTMVFRDSQDCYQESENIDMKT